MQQVIVEFDWKIRTPLHIGTGMSRIGGPDRLIRQDAHNEPYIPGEAVKGAIRGSAERLAGWLSGHVPGDNADSAPRNPVLRRIFQTSSIYTCDVWWRFEPALKHKGSASPRTELASTAIDPDSEVAKDHTLRVMEALWGGVLFKGRIEAFAADWSEPARQDLLFLCAAVLATEGIGGKKGIGFGRIECEDLRCTGPYEIHLPDYRTLANAEVIARLRSHLGGNRGGEAAA